MRPCLVKQVKGLRGNLVLIGDKAIAHRAVIVSSLSNGNTRITNFPANKDCLVTLEAFRQLGITIKKKYLTKDSLQLTIRGNGLWGLAKPRGAIFSAESGTTYRLLLGVLAGQPFFTKLTCAASLAKRPMHRVTAPLRLMGAEINAKCKTQNAKHEEYPPITIKGGNLEAINYKMPIASAQVKSAILLAGLFAQGKTAVFDSVKTRDHTERMLKAFKASIKVIGNSVVIKGQRELVSPGTIHVPSDISSAAFFIVAAAIIPDSRITIKNVSLNPSRIGVLKVLKRMGAKIRTTGYRLPASSEPTGDLLITTSNLKGTTIRQKEIPFLIDEIPILMVAACFARGKTIIEGAQELRVKETDRIASMEGNLSKMGANIKVINKGFSREDIVVEGVDLLQGAHLKSFGDHRTAMSLIIAGLRAEGETRLDDTSCINKSFPSFLKVLSSIIRKL